MGFSIQLFNFILQSTDNSLPWEYENIIFWASDIGIKSITWHSHTTTGEIISEDTGVISFEEAREIFETMIVTTYGASEKWPTDLSEVSIDIDDIELSLVRVREQNASGRNGIYTPAWVFYGNIKKSTRIMTSYSMGGVSAASIPSLNFLCLLSTPLTAVS